MKWFNLNEIKKEIGKIRWAKKEELLKTFLEVCVFITVFAIFFIGADLVVSFILKLLGI